VAVLCEHGNKFSGFRKRREVLSSAKQLLASRERLSDRRSRVVPFLLSNQEARIQISARIWTLTLLSFVIQ
jgi:hypothetical protein